MRTNMNTDIIYGERFSNLSIKYSILHNKEYVRQVHSVQGKPARYLG